MSARNVRNFIHWDDNGGQEFVSDGLHVLNGGLQSGPHLLMAHGLLWSHVIRQLTGRREREFCKELFIRQCRHPAGKEGSLILCSPGLSSLGLHLVDPALVDVHWIGLDVKRLVIHDLLDNRCQDLPQSILSPGTSVEAHHHLDDCGVSCNNLLHLVHLWPVGGRWSPAFIQLN